MRRLLVLACACLVLTLAGCDALPWRKPAEAAAPTLVSGLAGLAMDQGDRRRTLDVLETMPSGQATKWRNPETGDSYVMTPTRTFERGGATCRDYVVDAWVAGRPDKFTGTACRDGDGGWRAQP